MISHISCASIFHYCCIEGERWRLRSCSTPIHQQRALSEELTATTQYSPDILLSFVEFLSQIFSRCLTGDLNHGQLLAIASHVAGGLTDTVIVVFLYQKVCGWSKSLKNIYIYCDHHEASNKPAYRRSQVSAKNNCSHDRRNVTFAAIVHFPWKQIMTEATILRKEGEKKRGGIYLISVKHRHITNLPNGIFKQ